MKILLVIATILAGAVAQDDEGWSEPYFTVINDSKISEFSREGQLIKFTMKEDVGINFEIGKFLYTGDGTFGLNGLPDDTSYFEIDQEQKILKTKKEVDYESDKTTFKISIIVKRFELEFEITLSNVNDNRMFLDVVSPVPCKHDENKMGISNCQFKISDKDGIDPSIQFSFLINENNAQNRFKMHEDYSALIGKYEAVVTLEFLQKEDFETENKIILNWIAEDGDLFKDNLLITIHIEDVADMPPEWITLLGSIEIDELQGKTIPLEARDGDLVVQSPIEYIIQCETKSLCSDKLIINGANLEISPISLADNEENSILFKLIAKETLAPKEEKPQNVALLIKDINNHAPEININKGEIDIDEHYNKPLDVEITIEDKDSGDFGTYDVSLTSNLKNLVITDIFQIIPSTGYKKGSLSLSILNPSLLDYDDPKNLDLHDFKITIHSKDDTKNQDPSKSNTDEKTISIKLINLNDEIPVWASSTGYELELLETYGRYENKPLDIRDNFYADDKDIGAFGEVSYEIVGAASQKILKLVNPNPAKGESIVLETIPVPNGQIFDFEYQQEVLVSIMAKDNDIDNQHLVVTQLTIKVLDVNDELPVLSSTAQTATIEEETAEANVLEDIVFTVTDADSKPKLDIIVDWEKSYGVKLGTKLTTEFEQYKGLFTFKVQGNTNDAQKIIATLELDLSKPLLDYNVLDTIYLFILASDKNGEEPKSQTAETTLIINIANINNKAPEFETISDMQVKENSDVTIVGIVRAFDPDNIDKIIYKLEPENGLLEIKEDGKILVKDGSKIEADPDKYVLKYKVTASDSKFSTPQNIEIEIIDVNDNNPNFQLEPQYYMEEHSQPNWDLISVDDKDRDAINKNFECLLSDENFKVISDNLGCKIELITGKIIDRDGPNGKSSIDLTLKVHNHQALVPNTVTEIFKIEVKDINDNSPEIKPGIILQANENDEANSEIAGTIEFEDIDEGENANVVEYKLVEIEQEGTSESKLQPTHFDFIRINEQATKLKLLKSIKDCYGDYQLHIVAKDNGSPPLESVKDIPVKLHIDKYNSKPVIFVTPPDQVVLKQTQKVNSRLELWSGGYLDPIQASDQQGGKYEIQFNFVDESGSIVEHDFFTLDKEGSDKVNLMLKTVTNLGGRYTIRMSANSIDAIPLTTEAYHEMNILFLDTDAAPVFNEDAPPCKIDETYIGKLPCVLPKATYFRTSFNSLRQDELADIFYHILKEESMPADAYEIEDNLKNEVSVILELDLVKYDEAYFTVEASPSDKPSEQPNENSLLRVTLERNEVNNHAPVFDKDETSSLGIMLIGMIIGDTLMSVKATDPDHDQITYTITSYQADESLPAESTEPLFVSGGDLKLNFKVQSHMTGRIECTITAFDGKYKATKDVELYVISDIHLTSIVFENELSVVQKNEDNIKTIFQDYFKYRVGIRSIYEVGGGSTYDEATTSSTEVIAYFIDTDKKVGIEKEEIQSKMNNIAFYAQLRDAFVKVSLLLKNVIIGAEEESLEETYKIALIIVSAVSGVLLIGLIGFFTYKIRSQNNRLDRMDQAEARRPTMIQAPNLPGANRRATQVFNPNIKQEKEFEEKDDLSFTNSPRASSFNDPFDDDDEDFVGVENNDIFKTNPSKA